MGAAKLRAVIVLLKPAIPVGAIPLAGLSVKQKGTTQKGGTTPFNAANHTQPF
jgi:hypothetical protein